MFSFWWGLFCGDNQVGRPQFLEGSIQEQDGPFRNIYPVQNRVVAEKPTGQPIHTAKDTTIFPCFDELTMGLRGGFLPALHGGRAYLRGFPALQMVGERISIDAASLLLAFAMDYADTFFERKYEAPLKHVHQLFVYLLSLIHI